MTSQDSDKATDTLTQVESCIKNDSGDADAVFHLNGKGRHIAVVYFVDGFIAYRKLFYGMPQFKNSKNPRHWYGRVLSRNVEFRD
ncbi:MAG: hypothetical protein KDA88_23785 [Planctomycetaceae bacterium]|nr:hypothetical protein [Planctomycetaceae bacterium]MCB9951386.1 hypothetical protein [Planctomycetaceae bacterium]